jgi:hypothetical protein
MVLKLTGFVQKISMVPWDDRVLIDTSDEDLVVAVAKSHAALRQALADCVHHGSDELTIDAAAALTHLDDMPVLEGML